MTRLFDQLSAETSLWAAWRRVRKNKGVAGTDAQTVSAFDARAKAEVARLARELRSGSYRPRALLRIGLPKPNGGLRVLRIPAVRDRVAQSSTTLSLRRLAEPRFSDASFGYRQGRSVEAAAARVLVYRLRGYHWVLDADIDSYFDSIPHALLLADVRGLIGCGRTIELIRTWIEQMDTQGLGIPQGSPISPLLANLFLTPIDREFDGRKTKIVRYADDLVVLTRSRAAAEAARARLSSRLRERGLTLNAGKTRIVHIGTGLSFLGVTFKRGRIDRA